MTIIVEDEELPSGIKFRCKINGVTYLVLHRTKRGKRRNAKEKMVVYSDSDHTIIADTMREIDNTQTHSELIPQFNF